MIINTWLKLWYVFWKRFLRLCAIIISFILIPGNATYQHEIARRKNMVTGEHALCNLCGHALQITNQQITTPTMPVNAGGTLWIA